MMKRRVLFAILLPAACLAIASCGGGGGSTAGISVRVSPSSPLVETDCSQSFMAEVSGTADTAVTWSVQEVGGGTIAQTGDASATYTAPSVASTYHVVATSVADASRTATSEVRVYELPPDPP